MPTPRRRRRVAYLSYSTAEYDSRTLRMARSAVAAGYDVTIYALWRPHLPRLSEQDGIPIVRVASTWYQGIPGLGRIGRMAASAQVRRAEARGSHGGGVATGVPVPTVRPSRPSGRRAVIGRRLLQAIRVLPLGRKFLHFPVKPMGWADALVTAAEPADIWHGMWTGSLPALRRLHRRHGGRTIYDSRDVYLHARDYDRMNRVGWESIRAMERHWARAADAVLTTNDAYADILERMLGIKRPTVVMNCPERWTPPDPRPDCIRQALAIPATTRIVLYQGNLLDDRGIEQSMDAILDVPQACLVLMGYGASTERYRHASLRPPYRDRVLVLPAVAPAALLEWTASADVLVAAIQPTTLNHRYTTPQKLFEAMAAGVPVVASDLPGIAGVVTEAGCGVLCDPTSPSSIAAGLRRILDDHGERRAMVDRGLQAAHQRYNWETQVERLLAVYAALGSVDR